MNGTPGIEPISPDVEPEPKNYFYPAVLDKTLHPTVLKVLNMTNAEFARRYCQIHRDANESTLLKLMNAKVSFYRWGGADLMRAKDSKGQEKMVIIEMNSCPSGNKSVPFKEWGFEGFRRVMANAFVPLLAQKNLPVGGSLAVFYDVAKQRKESLAYATMLAKMTGETVYLADVGYGMELPAFLKWSPEGVCSLEIEPGTWKEMRAVFRYVTRRPWVKIPLLTKTVVLNPVIACLAGGRNKLLAAKAYEIFNDKYGKSDGLRIHFPLSITDVTKQSIPKYAEQMNYQLVVKVPYSNCGVGVYTITSPKELQDFLNVSHVYDKFVVQGLISHEAWPVGNEEGQLHHVGCRPRCDPDNKYVNDLRFMICAGPNGFMPVALYSRRSAAPLKAEPSYPSWEMLGTNLSLGEDGTSGTDTTRLLLLDKDTYSDLNLGLDELIESYVQTILAATAVEDLCRRLMSHFADDCIVDTSAATFDLALFKQLDEDRALLREIARGCAQIARMHPELQHVADDESPPPPSVTATIREQQQFPTSHLNCSTTNGDTSPTICDKIGQISATSG